MDLVWAHLCDYALVGADNKLSVIGMFDRLRTARGQMPTIGSAFIVAQFTAPITEGTNHPIDLVIVDEDGNAVGPRLRFPLQLAPAGPREPLGGAVMFRLANVRLPRDGVYLIEFHAQRRRIATLRLTVEFVDPPQGLLPHGGTRRE